MTKLPPLPLEEAIWDDPERGMVPVGYTADQMLDYGQQCREAALEEVANICEDHYGEDFRLTEEIRAMK